MYFSLKATLIIDIDSLFPEPTEPSASHVLDLVHFHKIKKIVFSQEVGLCHMFACLYFEVEDQIFEEQNNPSHPIPVEYIDSFYTTVFFWFGIFLSSSWRSQSIRDHIVNVKISWFYVANQICLYR